MGSAGALGKDRGLGRRLAVVLGTGQVRQQRPQIPGHVDHPQDPTIRILRIVHEQIGKSLYRPKAEPAGQQIQPAVTKQRPARHALGGVCNSHGEAVRERWAGGTLGNVVDTSVDVSERLRRKILRLHTAAPYFSTSRALTRATIWSPVRQPSRSASA